MNLSIIKFYFVENYIIERMYIQIFIAFIINIAMTIIFYLVKKYHRAI